MSVVVDAIGIGKAVSEGPLDVSTAEESSLPSVVVALTLGRPAGAEYIEYDSLNDEMGNDSGNEVVSGIIEGSNCTV